MSIRVASPAALYRWLNDALIPYAVLRAPRPEVAAAGDRDVDLLVEDAAVPRIAAAFAGRDGVKCDLYGVRGAPGADYHGHSHLPERLGRRILARRRLRREGFYAPHPEDELLALLYHVAYHKNLQSRIHQSDPARSGDGPYRRLLETLLDELGVSLPLSHERFHDYLERAGFGVEHDPLVAYIRHDFRRGRKSFLHARLLDRLPGEMNLYVIRRVAVETGRHEDLVARLAERFRILVRKEIPRALRWRARSRMRGGNWRRGGLPHIALVVFDEAPAPTSADERAVHPFVFNRNQFVKQELRGWFTAAAGRREKDNPVHSTDNEAEAIGHLRLFFSPREEREILERVARLRHGRRNAAGSGCR